MNIDGIYTNYFLKNKLYHLKCSHKNNLILQPKIIKNKKLKRTNAIKFLVSTTIISFLLTSFNVVIAQSSEKNKSSLDVFKDEIIVTATKRKNVNVQNAPLAITAFSAKQLDALHVQDISDLSYATPNVQIEDIGTSKGVANLTIRGLGVNSSIPSIDPTVGVFIDGVYMGVNSGVILDTFDLAGVEVVRGPQGVLFGRNVTGGALLIKTANPSKEFLWKSRIKVETGLSKTYSSVVSGSFGNSGFSGRLGIYVNDDDGWFTNLAKNATGGAGESSTTLYRGALAYENENFNVVAKYENGSQDGDGPSATNHGIYSNKTFDFANDEEGFSNNDWNMFSLEFNKDVSFGNGTITNIFGYRNLTSRALSDIDATQKFLFHAYINLEQSQFSDEIRYSGTFNNADITTGLFYFQQDIDYVERRLIPPLSLDLIGGGVQDHNVLGMFFNVDYHFSDQLTLLAGVRYSKESKAVKVQSILPIALGACSLDNSCKSFNFTSSDNWSGLSPKVGVKYQLAEKRSVYATYSRGFRSGGYNLRNTSPTAAPGPFNQETVSSFEVGFKTDLPNDMGRLNLAVFTNKISDMQREVNTADPTVGVIQIIQNTADAAISGIELETQVFINNNFLFSGSVGYVDASYDKVLADISGDGVVDTKDKALDIPRAAPLTYSLALIADFDFSTLGSLSGRMGVNHRDGSAYTDNNLGVLTGADIVNFNLTWKPTNSGFDFSLYGKNLTNEVTWGNDTQLPFFPGASFLPLNKGRIIGIEVVYNF